MTNYASQSDPGRNPNFSRTWSDDPLTLPGFEHLDREISPQAVENVGRRAIGDWLDRASEGHGAVTARAFQQADAIRRKMGLAWAEIIEIRSAA